jgi:hypothetical protein
MPDYAVFLEYHGQGALDGRASGDLRRLFLKSSPTIFTQVHSQKNNAWFLHAPQVDEPGYTQKRLAHGLRSESTD